MEIVYHYTDTSRLPWILKDGYLDQCANNVGDYPEPSFLWATTDSRNCKTASSCCGSAKVAYRDGRIRLVRFLLPADAFMTWPEAQEKFPAWTPEHVERLETAAWLKGDTAADVAAWRCRAERLELTDDMMMETRSYRSRWEPLSGTLIVTPTPDVRGIEIDGQRYISQQSTTRYGSKSYALAVAS